MEVYLFPSSPPQNYIFSSAFFYILSLALTSEGKVYAPFDGECENLADTLHAMGLLSDSGVSVLIHVGLETVGLEGKPFRPHVKTGDRIKKGQLLLEFDMAAIKAAGCPTIVPVLIMNEDEVGDVVIENDTIVIGG